MALLLDEFSRLFLSRQVAPPGGLQKATYKFKRNCFLHLQASFPMDLLEVSKESHLGGGALWGKVTSGGHLEHFETDFFQKAYFLS